MKPDITHLLDCLSPNPDVHLDLGSRLYRFGLYNEAVTAFSRAIELAPSSETTLSIAYRWRGTAFADLGCYEKVVDDLSRAVQIRPDSWTCNNLGFAYEQLGQLEKAAKQYLHAVALNPSNPVALHNLGTAYSRFGRYEEATQKLTEAIELEPSAASYFQRSLALCGLGKSEDAAQDFSRACDMDPLVYRWGITGGEA